MSDPNELHINLQKQLEQLDILLTRKTAIVAGYQLLPHYEQLPHLTSYETLIEILNDSINAKTLEILKSPGKQTTTKN